MLFEITILIPVARNDGRLFDNEHHRPLRALLAQTFGGYSELPDRVKGGWHHEGRLYEDETIAFVVGLRSLAGGAEVVKIAKWACTHYAQLAIAVRFAGSLEIVEA